MRDFDELERELSSARAQDIRLVAVATLAFCGILFVLNTATMDQADTTPPIGKVIPNGTVRHRPGRTLEWTGFDAEFPVRVRDSVFTPKNSSARIEFNDGAKIDLRPNTLIKIVEHPRNQTELEVVFGDATGGAKLEASDWRDFAYACQKKAVPALPEPELVPPPPLPAPRQLAKLPPRPKEPNYLPLSSLDYFNIKLVNPADQSTLTRRSLWVKFQWTSVPVKGVKYDLQVGRDRSYVSSIGSQDAKQGERLLINLPGKYYARIRAKVGDKEIGSSTNEFTIDTPKRDIATPPAEPTTPPKK